MSVVFETTIGDFTIDLYLDDRPRTCLNFLKLCKMKYYNLNLIYSVERNFVAQMGDPSGTGRGGCSIFSTIYGEQARFYEGEKVPPLKHKKIGTVSMASCSKDYLFGSQFFITLGEDLDSLDEDHLIFGEITEGLEILDTFNKTVTDDNYRPYQDIRITHTVVLHDPYPDPKGLEYPSRSPSPTEEMLESNYIAVNEEVNDNEGKSLQELQERTAVKEAEARATILEMVGDLPEADVAPVENVLFVCKLNPVTTSEDLEIIFSRFGKIKSCEIIFDKLTKNSLQYGFIEFSSKQACEDAYFKMDNVLIDDRRIHVDFNQSVSRLRWKGKGRIEYFDDQGRKTNDPTVFNPNIFSRKDDRSKNKHFDDRRRKEVPQRSLNKSRDSDTRLPLKEDRYSTYKDKRDKHRDRSPQRKRDSYRESRDYDRKYDRDREDYNRRRDRQISSFHHRERRSPSDIHRRKNSRDSDRRRSNERTEKPKSRDSNKKPKRTKSSTEESDSSEDEKAKKLMKKLKKEIKKSKKNKKKNSKKKKKRSKSSSSSSGGGNSSSSESS